MTDYRKGPVLLRGKNVPLRSTSGRLLDEQSSADWLHSDQWRVLRIQSEFVEGFGALAELGVEETPVVALAKREEELYLPARPEPLALPG